MKWRPRACVRCKVIGAMVTSAGKSRGAVVSALQGEIVTDEQVAGGKKQMLYTLMEDPLQSVENMALGASAV